MVVALHCVYVLLSFFSSALIGGLVDHVLDFNGGTTFAVLGILFLLSLGVHLIIADVRFFRFYKVRSSIPRMRFWLSTAFVR